MILQSTPAATPPPPAIGDIRLVPYTRLRGYYEVRIYYADGVTPGYFGGVCADNSYKEESMVICHQMGYKYVDYQYR